MTNNDTQKRDFASWLATFRQSINGYDYYIDFQKVYENAEKLKVQIHILNSLISSKNIEDDFENILNQYPECLKAIPILLAVRGNEIYCQDKEKDGVTYNFNKPTQSIAEYKYFMQKTGLFDMLKNHIICNLYDYVTGVEVGLDSNGRKNRGGHQMENLVEQYIQEAIRGTNTEYHKEMYLKDIEGKWNYDLSAISADGTSSKRWDFVVKTPRNVYAIETNFYTGSGSKLNETSRSYKTIALEAKQIANFSFVWITDGLGWQSASRNLEETFNVLDTIYNINDLENDMLKKLFV